MDKLTQICGKKCYGFDNYHGSCCKLENRDWIIGPVTDAHETIEKLQKHFKKDITYQDIFIEYEEGSRLFPERMNWQNPEAYPAMRINIDSKNLDCVFYNNTLKGCSIYKIRPQICKNYQCDYLKNELNPDVTEQVQANEPEFVEPQL